MEWTISPQLPFKHYICLWRLARVGGTLGRRHNNSIHLISTNNPSQTRKVTEEVQYGNNNDSNATLIRLGTHSLQKFRQQTSFFNGKGEQTYQALQMLHEYLQADIIRKDGLPSRTTRAVHGTRHMGSGRVQLGEQETSLTSSLVANNVPGNRESVDEEVLNDGH